MYAKSLYPRPQTVYDANEFQRIHDKLVAALVKANRGDLLRAEKLQASKAEWDRTHVPVDSALDAQ